jgi:hypothetical protein
LIAQRLSEEMSTSLTSVASAKWISIGVNMHHLKRIMEIKITIKMERNKKLFQQRFNNKIKKNRKKKDSKLATGKDGRIKSRRP